MAPAHDLLLKEVGQALTQFADWRLRPLLRDSQAHPGAKELAAQLLLLQWRSRDAFLDFGEFYCIRLLLDQQSALASYFIDLLSQLHWMMRYFDYKQLYSIADTCRLVYAAYKMLPTQEIGSRSDQEYKRAGRVGRMFSSNQLHCKMRQMGFVNLDQQGDTLVCLKEELGSGAFATVFKGVFEANQKRIYGSDAVAVKIFTNRSVRGSSLGCQLLQSMEGNVDVKDDPLRIELGRLISVRHPNIVTPRGYIGKRPQGESGLVMDLMDESLHDYLTKVKEGSLAALTELEMLDLMLEIAKGMRALHECNLMHRDLKPRNVLLRYLTDQDLGCNRFEVKLADFGHTKLYSLALDGMKDKPTHTAPVGTPCYMAPELHTGSAQTSVTLYEEKLDVFSYGTTCFNILIGDPDPEAFVPSRKAFYEAVKTRQWKQWVQDVEGSRSRMVQVVDRCWETEPSLRPTFATLCSLLQHCLRLCLTSGLPQRCHIGSLKSLKSFQTLAVEKYFQHCKSILQSLEQCTNGVDLHFTNGILEKFDELRRAQLAPKVVEVNDYAKDVAMFLKSLKRYTLSKGHPQNMSESEMFDSCLETSSDPLIFIKGLACHSIFSVSPWNSSVKRREFCPFNFTNDEAHCELQVDASLVPLLVGFWTDQYLDVDAEVINFLRRRHRG